MAGAATELQAHRITDKGEPHRIEPVQHPHLSARIPPLLGESREAVDLGRIDGSVREDIRMLRLVRHVNDFVSSRFVHRPPREGREGGKVAAQRAHRYVYAPFCPRPPPLCGPAEKI